MALPIYRISMGEFNHYCCRLDVEEDLPFVEFAACGTFVCDGVKYQAHLDHNRNRMPDEPQLSFSRDYDSLLAVVENIPTEHPLTICPFPDLNRTLRSNIHIKLPITSSNGQVERIPIHRIPNLYLGFFGSRHTIHLIFPRLYGQARRDVALTPEERNIYYNLGLYPTVDQYFTSTNMSDWPPTLEAEAWRARNANGSFTLSSKMLPEWANPQFARSLRTTFHDNGVEWGEDFRLLITIQGTKGSSSHGLGLAYAEETLVLFLSQAGIEPNHFEEGEWYIDVGLEVASTEDDCVEWRTSDHSSVVREALQIDEAMAERTTSMFSAKYSRDFTTSLTGVSGCRIEPGARNRGIYEAVYLQMYTTGKSLTFHRSRYGTAKAMLMSEAMGHKQPPSFVQGLHSAFVDAAQRSPSNARIEVRVPIAYATQVLQDIDMPTLISSLIIFPKEEYWMFKAYRLKGFSKILSRQASGPCNLRLLPSALALTAACVRGINALHARPDDRSASRELMRCCLPLAEVNSVNQSTLPFRVKLPPAIRHAAYDSDYDGGSDDDDDYVEEYLPVPHNPYGLEFFKPINLDFRVPRFFPEGPMISDRTIRILFGNTRDELEALFERNVVPYNLIRTSTRISRNKTRLTRQVTPPQEDQDVSLFNIQSLGVAFSAGPSDGETEAVGNEGVDMVVTKLWRQFFADIAAKSPAMRGRSTASYLRLTDAQREQMGENLLNTTALSDVWRRVQWRRASKEHWQRAFDYLFPDKTQALPKSVQNYTQCLYYRRWRSLINHNHPDTVKVIRRVLFDRIRTFAWIPNASSDKLWVTSVKKQFHMYPVPEGDEKPSPAPQILYHEDRPKPQWNQVDDDDIV